MTVRFKRLFETRGQKNDVVLKDNDKIKIDWYIEQQYDDHKDMNMIDKRIEIKSSAHSLVIGPILIILINYLL